MVKNTLAKVLSYMDNQFLNFVDINWFNDFMGHGNSQNGDTVYAYSNLY